MPEVFQNQHIWKSQSQRTFVVFPWLMTWLSQRIANLIPIDRLIIEALMLPITFYSVSLTLTHIHTQNAAHTSREALSDAHQRHNVRITAWIARILLLTFRQTLTQEKSVPINSLQIKQISKRTGTGANKTQERGSQGWTHSIVAANTHRHAHLDLTDRLRPHWSQWDALTFAHVHTHAQTHARMWCKLSTGFPPSISFK